MGYAFSKNFLFEFKFHDEVAPGFPLIIDDTSLAYRLGKDTKQIWYYIKSIEGMLVDREKEPIQVYKFCSIPQFREDGTIKKFRHIQIPDPGLKSVQKSLNNLFTSVELPKSVAAYVRGMKPADAAEQHVRPTYWFPQATISQDLIDRMSELDKDPRYKRVKRHKEEHDPSSTEGWFYYQPLVTIHLDISNFFNSVRRSWIRKFLTDRVGYSHYVADLISVLCCVKKDDRYFLPQGSPSSGSVANHVANWMFGETIQEGLDSHSSDWVFTIYSDDIVMSHPDLTISDEEVDRIKNVVIGTVEGSSQKVYPDKKPEEVPKLSINQKKVRVVRTKNSRVKILGCVINEKLNLPKEYIQKTRTILNNCINHGWGHEMATFDVNSPARVREILRGTLQYIRQVNEDKYKELNALFKDAESINKVADTETTVLRETTEPEKDPTEDILF